MNVFDSSISIQLPDNTDDCVVPNKSCLRQRFIRIQPFKLLTEMQAARPAALLGLLALSAVAALALLATAAPAASAAPAAAPAQDIERAMEALKYLQELDRYYSQVARPSPRSELTRSAETFKKDNLYLKMLQLQTLDRIYAPRTRPRFGKRTEARPFSDDSLEEASNEKLWRRFSRRR